MPFQHCIVSEMEVYEVTIILPGRLCLCFNIPADENKTQANDCQNVKKKYLILNYLYCLYYGS